MISDTGSCFIYLKKNNLGVILLFMFKLFNLVWTDLNNLHKMKVSFDNKNN